jgi:spore germination cell wall hydrolase CwlJ-like protein
MTSRVQPIVGVIAGLALVMALFGCGSSKNDKSGQRTEVAGLAPPSVEPVAYRNLTPEDAIAYNSALPVALDPGPEAKPFFAAPGLTFSRAAACLTDAIYYEAATEPLQGQRGVAQVIINRVRHPAYPKSVCNVIYQGAERTTGCQFSFTCDGSLLRSPSLALWKRARAVAVAALSGHVEPSVGLATHYHANYVVPYWASSLKLSATLGAHIFYRWNGRWGAPGAFTGRYAQLEPDPSALLQKIRLASAAVRGPQTPILPYAPDLTFDALAAVSPPARHPLAPHVVLKADEEVGALRDELEGSRPLLVDLASRGELVGSPAAPLPKRNLVARTD